MIATNTTEFKAHISSKANEFASHQKFKPDVTMVDDKTKKKDEFKWYHVGQGLKKDLLGRLPFYFDDFKDGIFGPNTLQKTIATTLFLLVSTFFPPFFYCTLFLLCKQQNIPSDFLGIFRSFYPQWRLEFLMPRTLMTISA